MATDTQKAAWYDQIAPRLTNFGNDLPDGVVVRGVQVLTKLRDFKRTHAAAERALIELNIDDLSCFLMCVDQFWEANRNADIAARLHAHKMSGFIPSKSDHGTTYWFCKSCGKSLYEGECSSHKCPTLNAESKERGEV